MEGNYFNALLSGAPQPPILLFSSTALRPPGTPTARKECTVLSAAQSLPSPTVALIHYYAQESENETRRNGRKGHKMLAMYVHSVSFWLQLAGAIYFCKHRRLRRESPR